MHAIIQNYEKCLKQWGRGPTVQHRYISSVLCRWDGCFPGGIVIKNPPISAGDARDTGSIPGSGRFPWQRKWQPTPVYLPGEPNGQRGLAGYIPQDHKQSDMTEATQHAQMGWRGMRDWSKRVVVHVYLQLINFIVQQKLTQHCKATIPQFKNRTPNCLKQEKIIYGHSDIHTLLLCN